MATDIINKNNLYPILLTFFNGVKYSYYYSFCIVGDDYDFILNKDGKICFFHNLKTANVFLKHFNYDICYSKSELNKSLLSCNINEVIEHLEKVDFVENSWLLDATNLLLDCLNSLIVEKNEHIKILSEFANYLTFDLNYTNFFIEKYNRVDLLNSYYWLIGLIHSKMLLLNFSK